MFTRLSVKEVCDVCSLIQGIMGNMIKGVSIAVNQSFSLI